jgi:hypothetical protein
METTINNRLEHYKNIEALCAANQILWETCPNFRGAFSKFALRVSQLDLIANGEVFIQQMIAASSERVSHLVREIDSILTTHFDRYFAYLNQRNLPIYAKYSALRQKTFA